MTENAHDELIDVETLPCISCGKTSIITVNRAAFMRWMQGMLIQQAMPDVAPEIREQLINGTHPECFAKLF